MTALLRTFAKDGRGTFAVKTALIAPILIVAIGIALDYSRLGAAASDLQDAADAAAISGAAALMRGKESEWKDNSKSSLKRNAENHPQMNIETIKVTKTENSTVRVETSARLQPMFPQVLGYPRYDLSRVSEATYGTAQRLELAIVIDTTNSMMHAGAWTTAVATMENLFDDMKEMTGQSNFFVTLIPYQNRVNIGKLRASWVGGSVPPTWEGCVEPREERIGSFDWAVDDDTSATEPFALANTAKHPCNVAPIAGPTNNPEIVSAAARGLSIGQSGRFDQGLAWGWRAVSPKWTGRWGQPGYPSPVGESRKVVIFMTDGNTTVYETEMSSEQDLGWNNGSTVAFQHLEDLCSRMKHDGIELFILRLPGNHHSEPYMRRCATSPSHYLEADGADKLPQLIGTIRDEMQDELRLIR